ncbi:MAG: hypothetical protein ABIG44_15360, partial [Planctomycetota bacterium]
GGITMMWWQNKREKESIKLYKLPLAVRRAMLLGRIMALAIPLGLIVWVLSLGGTSGTVVVVFLPVFMFMMLLQRELSFLRARRYAKALTRKECLYCGYSLHGLPLPHPCPECGVIYDEQRLAASLRTAFGIAPPETSLEQVDDLSR